MERLLRVYLNLPFLSDNVALTFYNLVSPSPIV
jgi:hypothetical protein